MLVKTLKTNKNSIVKAMNYLEKDDAIYNKDNADICKEFIKSSEKSYTSFSLSFHKDESQELAKAFGELTESFKNLVFAGIDKQHRPPISIITHKDKGRYDTHIIVPNCLQNGKTFTPYFHKTDRRGFTAWQEIMNDKHKMISPQDRLKKIQQHNPRGLTTGADKQAIEQYFADNYHNYNNRDECLDELLTNNPNLKCTRKSKNYISIKDGDKKAFRLKGKLFNQEENYNELDPTTEQDRLRELEKRDERLAKFRDEFNYFTQQQQQKRKRLARATYRDRNKFFELSKKDEKGNLDSLRSLDNSINNYLSFVVSKPAKARRNDEHER